MKENYIAMPEKEDLVPLEAKFYYYSADSMIKKGNVEGAVKCFQMSRQINPHYLLPYWRLADIYTKVGLVEEGFKEYEKAYQMDKGDPLAKEFLEEAKNDLSERGMK
jgi:tetratricopeptide (TPR) repeat protein